MSRWSGKRVVVTGGSKGLGLEIARAFGRRGANLFLVARNQDELETACQDLTNSGIKADYQCCDVTDWPAVQELFAAFDDANTIDVLVNAVGKSTRANIDELDLEEAHEMMEVNYFSALHCVKAALTSLKRANGHVVNIGSLSSKTAWPFMTPYTTSKFALAALTHQLRVELRDQIHAMLVCPGPIKRDDAGTRYNEQTSDLPDEAKKAGGGARIKGICPERLAEKIVRGCETRKAEIIMPWKAKLLFIASAFSCRLGDWLLQRNRNK